MSPLSPRALASFVGLAALLVPAIAGADDVEPAFAIGPQPAWFLSGGVSTGGTVAVDDRGAFVGGELNLVRVRGVGFFGFRADGVYDFGVDRAYATGGIDLGFVRRGLIPLGFGIDADVAVRTGGGGALGAAGRVFVTVAGTLTLYGRYLHFGTGENDQVVQVGLAIKMPLIAPWGAGVY